jgi:mycoredoxin
MEKRIIVYTTSWCGDCRRLKDHLRENHVPFEEKDIERDEEAYRVMMGHTRGKRVIPTMDIGGHILVNPSWTALKEALSV